MRVGRGGNTHKSDQSGIEDLSGLCAAIIGIISTGFDIAVTITGLGVKVKIGRFVEC